MYKRTLLVYFVIIVLTGILVFFNNPKITGYLSLNEADKLIVSLDIPPDQQKINPGQSILLEVVIREIGGTIEETTPIDLEYSIKDLNDNIISTKQERGVIAVKQSEVTSLLIPTSTKPGVYMASVSVNYQGNTFIGTKTFEVLDNKKRLNLSYIFFYIFIIVIFIILFVLNRKKLIKYKKRKRR